MSAQARQARAARAMLVTTLSFWLVFVLGIVAGIAITGEGSSAWWRPSISHFGSVRAQSALVYNGIQIVDGALLILLAWLSYSATQPLVAAGWMGGGARAGIAAVLAFQGLLLVSLALLPYDFGGRPVYVYHNIAGWLGALVPAGCIVLAPLMLRNLPAWFTWLSVAVAAGLFASWFLFVIARVLAHGLSELGAFAAVAVWMIAFFGILTRESLIRLGESSCA